MERIKKNIEELTLMSCEEFKRREKFPLKVVVDSVRSGHNVGSLFRTADAFCLDEIILCGISCTPPHAEISKTALGADESVKWSRREDALEVVRELKKEGWKICVLEQTHNSTMLQNFKPSETAKYALVVGNEVDGVNQKIVDEADVVLEIPQMGTKHSLNVSVSAGIALWQFFAVFHSGYMATKEK